MVSSERQCSGFLAEEMLAVRLLEEGLDIARPRLTGPIDMLSIYQNETIKRLQVKSCYKRSDDYLRYTFTIKNFYGNSVDYLCLVGIETKSYWIIPIKKVGKLKSINCTPGGNNPFDKYFDAFSQLKN